MALPSDLGYITRADFAIAEHAHRGVRVCVGTENVRVAIYLRPHSIVICRCEERDPVLLILSAQPVRSKLLGVCASVLPGHIIFTTEDAVRYCELREDGGTYQIRLVVSWTAPAMTALRQPASLSSDGRFCATVCAQGSVYILFCTGSGDVNTLTLNETNVARVEFRQQTQIRNATTYDSLVQRNQPALFLLTLVCGVSSVWRESPKWKTLSFSKVCVLSGGPHVPQKGGISACWISNVLQHDRWHWLWGEMASIEANAQRTKMKHGLGPQADHATESGICLPPLPLTALKREEDRMVAETLERSARSSEAASAFPVSKRLLQSTRKSSHADASDVLITADPPKKQQPARAVSSLLSGVDCCPVWPPHGHEPVPTEHEHDASSALENDPPLPPQAPSSADYVLTVQCVDSARVILVPKDDRNNESVVVLQMWRIFGLRDVPFRFSTAHPCAEVKIQLPAAHAMFWSPGKSAQPWLASARAVTAVRPAGAAAPEAHYAVRSSFMLYDEIGDDAAVAVPRAAASLAALRALCGGNDGRAAWTSARAAAAAARSRRAGRSRHPRGSTVSSGSDIESDCGHLSGGSENAKGSAVRQRRRLSFSKAEGASNLRAASHADIGPLLQLAHRTRTKAASALATAAAYDVSDGLSVLFPLEEAEREDGCPSLRPRQALRTGNRGICAAARELRMPSDTDAFLLLFSDTVSEMREADSFAVPLLHIRVDWIARSGCVVENPLQLRARQSSCHAEPSSVPAGSMDVERDLPQHHPRYILACLQAGKSNRAVAVLASLVRAVKRANEWLAFVSRSVEGVHHDDGVNHRRKHWSAGLVCGGSPPGLPLAVPQLPLPALLDPAVNVSRESDSGAENAHSTPRLRSVSAREGATELLSHSSLDDSSNESGGLPLSVLLAWSRASINLQLPLPSSFEEVRQAALFLSAKPDTSFELNSVLHDDMSVLREFLSTHTIAGLTSGEQLSLLAIAEVVSDLYSRAGAEASALDAAASQFLQSVKLFQVSVYGIGIVILCLFW
jgi:hypothetical protein